MILNLEIEKLVLGINNIQGCRGESNLQRENMADIFGYGICWVVIIQWTAWSRHAEQVIRVFEGTNRFVLQFGQL